jgi:hypothetical protein
MAKRNKALRIYCDRVSLVKCLNLYKSKSPLPHEHKKITDRSLTLRILQEIHDRPGETTITYVKAHGKIQPGSSLIEQDRNQLRHQVHNQAADKAAKESLSEPSPLIPNETKHLPAVSVLCANMWHSKGPKYIYENNPLNLYQERCIESKQNYHLESTAKWPQYMLTDGIWEEPCFSVLHNRSNLSLTKFLEQVLGRTLPTFHRLNDIQPNLYPEKTCLLCPHQESESLEHLIYQCQLFTVIRHDLLIECSDLCQRILPKTITSEKI